MKRVVRWLCRRIWNYCFGDFLCFYYDNEGHKKIDIACEELPTAKKEEDV